MRAFAASAGFIFISVIFFIAFAGSAPVLMLAFCPGSLIALWVNGYAAARAGIKLTTPVVIEQPSAPPAPVTASRKPVKTMSDFQ